MRVLKPSRALLTFARSIFLTPRSVRAGWLRWCTSANSNRSTLRRPTWTTRGSGRFAANRDFAISIFSGPSRAKARQLLPTWQKTDAAGWWLLGGHFVLARVLGGDVVVDEGLESSGQFVVGAFERHVFFPVDIDRAAWSFAGAGKRNPDVRGLRFSRTVHDAAHHRQRHGFKAIVLRLPGGHHFPNIGLGSLG